MQINDCIVTALGGVGHINDLLLEFFIANGAVTAEFNDAQYEFLIAQGAAPAQINDMWYEFLTTAGYTGTINDMLYTFWCIDGGAVDLSAKAGWTGTENCDAVGQELVTIRFSRNANFTNGLLGVSITHSNAGTFTITSVIGNGTPLLEYIGTLDVPLTSEDTVTFVYDDTIGDYTDDDDVPMVSQSITVTNCLAEGIVSTWVDEDTANWEDETPEDWTTG